VFSSLFGFLKSDNPLSNCLPTTWTVLRGDSQSLPRRPPGLRRPGLWALPGSAGWGAPGAGPRREGLM